MTKFILGLNSIGFNTSASLIKDNKVVAAVEEERLSRVKRTRAFPTKAIKYCLDQGNISFEELDSVAISWNPLINLEKFDVSQSQNLSYIPSILTSTINITYSSIFTFTLQLLIKHNFKQTSISI